MFLREFQSLFWVAVSTFYNFFVRNNKQYRQTLVNSNVVVMHWQKLGVAFHIQRNVAYFKLNYCNYYYYFFLIIIVKALQVCYVQYSRIPVHDV